MHRAELAEDWAKALVAAEYVPRSPAQVAEDLLALVDRAAAVVAADEPDRAAAARLGTDLVRIGFSKSVSLQCTVEVFGRGLPTLPECADLADLRARVLTCLAGLVAGYTDAVRQQQFRQQQDIKNALIGAKENSDARFREMFVATAVGMAISEPNGRLVDVNNALEEILEHSEAGLPAGMTVFDMFHPDDQDYLRQRYQQLMAAEVPRFREQRRLLGRDDEEKWAFISVSLVRPRDDGRPYHVTMVEDITDQHLLEDRLSFQVQHDALTGLPNRAHFVGQLEKMAGKLPSTDLITVYHLALDNFTVVNDGLGRLVGDVFLGAVAGRLEELVAEQKAVVARLSGIEFAILVHQTPDAPSVAELAARINEELAEPVYLDGHGVAASASIGVVQRAAGEVEPEEMLRIADVTLRRVKAKGRGQWGLSDSELDAEDTARYVLAATVHGAWENGEIAVRYQPQVDLDTGRIVAVQGLLRWDHPEHGVLDHERCDEVIAETGLVLGVGRWLLREAATTAAGWHAEFGDAAPAIAVDLSVNHADDADLIGEIRGLLDDVGLPVTALRIGMPVAALCTVDGEAEDNLTTAVDLGVTTVLHGFGTTRGDLACLEDLPVHAVSVASRAVRRIANADGDSLFSSSMRGLVELVHQVGVAVVVPELDDVGCVDWWRGVGADFGQGVAFGAVGTAEEVAALLRARLR